MSKPIVSVCIPVYNGEKFIKDAITSVLEQTYTKFELLICDNNSSDNTEKVIKEFNDKRINYIKNNENIGGTENFNNCIKYSNGKYIKFLCADDVLKKNAIETMLNKIESDNDIGIVFCNYKKIDENNKIISAKQCDRKDKLLHRGNFTITDILTYKTLIPICTSFFIIRKDILEDVGYFQLINNNGYNSDLELVSRVLHKYHGYYISDVLAYNREHKLQGTNMDINYLNSFTNPMEFREYIINKYELKLSTLGMFKIKFDIFTSGLHHVVLIDKKINLTLIKHLINNYGINYILIFPFYLLLNYIPRKICTKIYKLFNKKEIINMKEDY